MAFIYILGTVFLLSIIAFTVSSEPCDWSNCVPFNNARCLAGFVEKGTQRCGGFSFLINNNRRFCCDARRCGYTGQCIPDSCKSNCPPACPSGKKRYDQVQPQDCTVTFAGMDFNGKQNWCCDV